MSLGVVTILQNTQAFWTAILAYYMNNESFHAIEGIGIVGCFIGVLLIGYAVGERPEEDVPIPSNYLNELFGDNEKTLRALGVLIMLFVAFNDASLNVMARTMKDVHYGILQFWFSAIGLTILVAYIVGDCLMRDEWPQLLQYNDDQLLYLVLTGIFSALNLTCLTIAYQKDNSATVSLLAYIELVYAFISDVTIFNISFVPKELIGAAIITFFNIFTIYYRARFADQSSISNA